MQNMNINKPWIDYISKRTFGMELEFADGDNNAYHFHQVTSGRITS
jgi:hypothetical protein